MSTVLLILQLILSIVLTVLILLQRSEGGALGIGGGGGGGLMSGRSAATSIVRITSIVGVIFVLNCIALTIVFNRENADTSIFDAPAATDTLTTPATGADNAIPIEDGVPAPVDTTPEDLVPVDDATPPEAEDE